MDRKEAIEVIKKNYPHVGFSGSEFEIALRELVPELKEREDERIRKELLALVRMNVLPEATCLVRGGSVTRAQAEAYLEKQKEQKPAEWNDTDMKEARNNLISVCRDWEFGKQTTLLPVVAIRARYFLEHLTEPKPAEWSEFDEDCLKRAIWYVENPAPSVVKDTNLALWLKSLRPKPHWKPSEEQMEALAWYSGNSGVPPTGDKAIKSLYADLQKLL